MKSCILFIFHTFYIHFAIRLRFRLFVQINNSSHIFTFAFCSVIFAGLLRRENEWKDLFKGGLLRCCIAVCKACSPESSNSGAKNTRRATEQWSRRAKKLFRLFSYWKVNTRKPAVAFNLNANEATWQHGQDNTNTSTAANSIIIDQNAKPFHFRHKFERQFNSTQHISIFFHLHLSLQSCCYWMRMLKETIELFSLPINNWCWKYWAANDLHNSARVQSPNPKWRTNWRCLQRALKRWVCRSLTISKI